MVISTIYRYGKATKLCFDYAHGQKASIYSVSHDILTDSDHYTKIKLLRLPPPGSKMEFEVTNELLTNTDTVFEQLHEAKTKRKKAMALSDVFSNNNDEYDIIRAKLTGSLIVSSEGNGLITKLTYNHENEQYPIEILSYQSAKKVVAMVITEKLPENIALHKFPIEPLIKKGIDPKKVEYIKIKTIYVLMQKNEKFSHYIDGKEIELLSDYFVTSNPSTRFQGFAYQVKSHVEPDEKQIEGISDITYYKSTDKVFAPFIRNSGERKLKSIFKKELKSSSDDFRLENILRNDEAQIAFYENALLK